MAAKVFLAVDLGASSGRVVAGVLDGSRLALDEVHRFANGPVRVGSRLHWDLLGLWSHLQEGLRLAAQKYPGQIVSLGVDTWGVDYGLLGPGDELLGNPYHYRDARTSGIFERTFEIVPRDEIFAATGVQFMELNTLFQLVAARLEDSPLLSAAESLLLMPDVFHWLLTGEKAIEETNASTTQLYDPRSGGWAKALIAKLSLPERIFGQIIPPGTRLGRLLAHVASETNLAGVDVVVPGTHDTASAVVAVPASEVGTSCYISSGTWSLMGVESPRPVINADAARWNFTNERGVGGTTRLLKNIAGLWLVQECQRIWQRQGHHFDWDDLVREAEAAPTLATVIAPDDPSLVAPDDMPSAIATLAAASGQPVPASPGATVRCALESLALRYRQVLGWLEQLTGARIETIHIVGGGTQNTLLNQLAADACQRRVLAGPVEATAIGNILVQSQAAGEVADIHQARALVEQSFELRSYEPNATQAAAWQAAAARIESLAV